jgi:hypothetical protein
MQSKPWSLEMPVSRNVFASQSERSNFYKLSRVWGDKYRIYHNLPFLNVFPVKVSDTLFDLSQLPPRPITITNLERNRLKKTSIDYTLCNQDDAPLICIEFDGLQQGYNLGTQYRTTDETADSADTPSWREQILGLKLRVAHGSFFRSSSSGRSTSVMYHLISSSGLSTALSAKCWRNERCTIGLPKA